MKQHTKAIVIIAALLIMASSISYGQGWSEIREGETMEMNGLEISYITSYIKQVKGQDVYTVTATISGKKIMIRATIIIMTNKMTIASPDPPSEPLQSLLPRDEHPLLERRR